MTRSKRKRKHGAENSSKSVQSRVMAKELRLKPVNKSEENVETSKLPAKQKRFCCKFCDKSYTQAHNLKSHIKKIHK